MTGDRKGQPLLRACFSSSGAYERMPRARPTCFHLKKLFTFARTCVIIDGNRKMNSQYGKTRETCPFPGVYREETPAAASVPTRKKMDTPRQPVLSK